MSDPAHALVYLDDEEQHGVGFPRGIEDDVEALLNGGARSAGTLDTPHKRPDT